MYKEDTFRVGESFHQVACDMIPNDWLEENDGYWFVPSIVNMAFACELYLKSMLSDGERIIQGHHLGKLFNQLGEEQKRNIINNPKFKGDEKFLNKLNRNSQLFVKWRYSFEPDVSASVDPIFLESLACILHDIAETELNTNG